MQPEPEPVGSADPEPESDGLPDPKPAWPAEPDPIGLAEPVSDYHPEPEPVSSDRDAPGSPGPAPNDGRGNVVGAGPDLIRKAPQAGLGSDDYRTGIVRERLRLPGRL